MTVVETALFLFALFTLFGIAVAGRLSLKRGEPTVKQIALSTITALINTLFIIVEQTLPDPVDSSQLPFWRIVYFLVWMPIFLLVPLFMLPLRDSLVLIVRLSIVAVVCFITGYILILIMIAACLYKWFDLNFCPDFGGPERFWLAKPSMLNMIGGAFFVAAFSPISRFIKHATFKLLDIKLSGFFIVFTVIYAGLFGPVFYVERADWAAKLVADNQVQKWQFFFPYAAFPVVVAVTSPLVFCQKGRFRWFLPLGLAFGFAVVVLLGFRPLLLLKDTSSAYICFLTIAHAVNGALLGLILVISDGIADRLPGSDTKPL